jgi:hypothetical protein
MQDYQHFFEDLRYLLEMLTLSEGFLRYLEL